MPNLRIKRVYEPPAAGDGYRILVDRLWPRGLRKSEAALDLWLKEIAPSTELRKWFGHEPSRWPEFQERYSAELDTRPEPVAQVLELARERQVTLLFSARDAVHNQAAALLQYLLVT